MIDINKWSKCVAVTDRVRVEVTFRIDVCTGGTGSIHSRVRASLLDGISLIDNVRIEELTEVSHSFAMPLLVKKYITSSSRTYLERVHWKITEQQGD